MQRHLTAAIRSGIALTTAVGLKMHGRIKVGRWLPFRARQVLSPHEGFLWTARAAGLIAGFDRYLNGVGAMHWKAAGLITVAHGEGPDVSRSAAGRGGVEAVWVPTALLPRFGVTWSAAEHEPALPGEGGGAEDTLQDRNDLLLRPDSKGPGVRLHAPLPGRFPGAGVTGLSGGRCSWPRS